jgi:DNA replication protein DnaC
VQNVASETSLQESVQDSDTRGPKPIGQCLRVPEDASSMDDGSRRAEEFERRQEANRRDREWRELIREMGSAYGKARFANYEAKTPYQQEVLEAVTAYAKEFPQRYENGESLVLYGPVGTGKDHLAAAVCTAVIMHHGMTAQFCKGQDWYGSIRDAIGAERTEHSVLAPLQNPQLLVISDPLPPFGNLTQHQASMLYRAVEHRAANGKPTLLTINVADDAEADARMGVPVWDRLKQRATLIHMAWESHRQPVRHIQPPKSK